MMHKAQEFYESAWGNEVIRAHSECVIEACVQMCVGTDLNEDVFVIAGWIHDIGRKIDKATHHELSLDFLDEFLEQNPQYSKLKEDIVDCIRHHRRDGTPSTVYGLVFKAADKVALHNKKWLALDARIP